MRPSVLPADEIAKAIGREFAALALSRTEIDEAKSEVMAATSILLASQERQHARLRKELGKLEMQEERLLDLAADGSLPTSKLRERLRHLQVKKQGVRGQLANTDELLHQQQSTILAYLDLLECPRELFVSACDETKRQLLTAFYSRIWVRDDGHRVIAEGELQPCCRRHETR